MPLTSICFRPRSRVRALAAGIGAAAVTIAISAGPAYAAGSTWTELSASGKKAFYGEQAKFKATVYGSGAGGAVKLKKGSKTLETDTLSVPEVDSNVIGAGIAHTCAITGSGIARCWGANDDGQVGDGTMTVRPTPVPVIGLPARIKAIAVGYYHTCALSSAGAAYCWGGNDHGQLGDGTLVDRSKPVPVTGLPSGIKEIGIGGDHTCAITEAGKALCWGDNSYGQLGDGTTTDRLTPVQVVSLPTGAAELAVGAVHNCVRTTAGKVVCWGYNGDGQLGDGSTVDKHTPAQVLGVQSNVVTIDTGAYHSCALLKNGTAKCWGSNDTGRLGDGTTTNRLAPAKVKNLPSDVTDISAGFAHSCARTASGNVRCWGHNGFSELGDGSTTDSLTAVAVAGLSNAIEIDTSYAHTCATRRTGAIACWGYNGGAQLGDGTITDRPNWVTPVGFGVRTALVPSTKTIKTAALPAGEHTLKARYGGDSNNAASSSANTTFTVKKGKTKIRSITVTPKKPAVGQKVQVKVRLAAKAPSSGKPAGRLKVKDGGKTLGTFKVRKGKSSFGTTFTSNGKHTLKTAYKGSMNWKKSAGKKTVKVGN